MAPRAHQQPLHTASMVSSTSAPTSDSTQNNEGMVKVTMNGRVFYVPQPPTLQNGRQQQVEQQQMIQQQQLPWHSNTHRLQQQTGSQRTQDGFSSTVTLTASISTDVVVKPERIEEQVIVRRFSEAEWDNFLKNNKPKPVIEKAKVEPTIVAISRREPVRQEAWTSSKYGHQPIEFFSARDKTKKVFGRFGLENTSWVQRLANRAGYESVQGNMLVEKAIDFALRFTEKKDASSETQR